jgi:Tfp pilus assembly protein PilN
MNFDQLSGKLEGYSGKAREGAIVGISKLMGLLTFNVLEGVVIPKKCLCAAIEEGAVSIAYGSRVFMKPEIKGFRRFDYPRGRYPTPDETVLAVKDAIGSFDARGTSIVLSVPRSWLIIRIAELPAVVKENLASVITYELDRLTPLAPADAMYDYSIISEENARLKLLVVAMRAETLRPYVDAFNINKLHAHRVTTGITGLGTVCRMLGNGGRSTVCLDIRRDGYDGCAVRDGVLHALIYDNFTDDEDENVRLIKEGITPILAELENEETPSVVLIKTETGYTKIRDEIAIAARPITDDDLRKAFGAGTRDDLTGPLGGLIEEIWPGEKGLDLEGKGIKESNKSPVRGMTYILLGIIVVAMALNLIVPLYMEKARLSRIEAEIASRRNQVRTVEAIRQEASTINADVTAIRNFKESSLMTLDIMKELTTILPKSVWLTRLRITGQTVEVEGYAASATEVLPRLEQSPLFRKVEFSSPTIRDARLNADRFVIKMEIEGFEKKPGPGAKNEKK